MKHLVEGIQSCGWQRWIVFPIRRELGCEWFNFRLLDLAATFGGRKKKRWYSLAHNAERYAQNGDYWKLLASEGEVFLFDLLAWSGNRK